LKEIFREMEGVGVMRWLKLCLMVLLVAFVTRCGLHAQHPSEELVIQAKALVEKVKPENTSYRHKNNEVSWGVKGEAVCHADCSGFINALLLHTGAFGEKDFKNHLGTERPLARHYYDAIIHQRGFVEITRIHEVKAGDIIAIRYPPGSSNTGHVMLVVNKPDSRTATEPMIKGTVQYEVQIVDSSTSGHGGNDSRKLADGKFHDGLGTGVFRIYTNEQGVFVGHAWSNYPSSKYQDIKARHIVVGRVAKSN